MQIIDRDQHGGMKRRDRHGECTCVVQIIGRTQHGVVRLKEPFHLRYTGSLATCSLKRQFTIQFLPHQFEQLQQLSKVIAETSISIDVKAFALCWEVAAVAYLEGYEQAEKLFKAAWKKAKQNWSVKMAYFYKEEFLECGHI